MGTPPQSDSLRRPKRGPTPSNWASLKPFGIGEQRPNNFAEVVRAVGENRGRLGYARRILSEGVCDGCALGTRGMRDWTLEGIHLCNIRLRLLRLNTIEAMQPQRLADAAALRKLGGGELRKLGRLPQPLLRRHGEPGFSPIGWEQALDLVAQRIRASRPDRLGFFLTSRGMCNENYYVAQKSVRALGTNSIDNAARICHSPSTFALKDALGIGASSCSYADWIGTDLVVFVGSNVATNQPVATKYLHQAKKAGTRVASLNPLREPGMDRYWIPSKPESALFGTKLVDEHFAVNIGGDIAFLSGALKYLIEQGWQDERFVAERTVGWEELCAALAATGWPQIEAVAGASRERIGELARLVGEAKRAVFVWSMGVTQHSFGEDGVRALINLALARGFVGREGCGLMPIRGHSGVQGGAEMGCYATSFPGGVEIAPDSAAALGEQWGFEVPSTPGLTAPQMLEAAGRGELDLLFSVGGNFLEVLPEPDRVRAALTRVPLRVHMDLVASSQMLVAPGPDAEVLLLPATTRYEVPGGVTQTSTERRVILSPEVRGPRVAAARPEWQVLSEIAGRANPARAEALRFEGTAAIRAEIERVIPAYRGIAALRDGGDSFQYGGRRLCEGERFPTADGRAHFSLVAVAPAASDDGRLALATRRGKQFNSMVQEQKDAITGASRDALLISPADLARLSLVSGTEVIVRSAVGELRCRAFAAPIAPGNAQVHWPEGNVLIASGVRSPESDIPDYNARVTVERAER